MSFQVPLERVSLCESSDFQDFNWQNLQQNVTIINIFIPIRYCGPVAQESENNAIFL